VLLAVLAPSIALVACKNESPVESGSGGSSGAGTGGASGAGAGGAGGSGAGGSSSAGTGGRGGSGGSGAGGASATGQGGRGGSAGATGAGGSASAGPACTATATMTIAGNGAAFPFPQNRGSAACIFPPTCTGDDAATGWQKYKARLIVDGGSGTLRVQRPENANDTVSEGIGYGMLFAVYFNDKATFDALWAYEQQFPDTTGLMNWHINSDGTVAGRNSATDSDEDMAFALVMADKQWGGYTTVAKDLLGKVAMGDFGADGTVKGGDTYVAVNPSYLAPAFYRAFAAYTGDARWTTILEKTYSLLAGAANATTGLVPDWSTGQRGPNYTYDATRTPFRVALDACWNGEPRAVAFSQKIGAFFAGIGAANIKDGYSLDGTVTGMYTNSAFVGPAGVAGMAANQPTLVADAYTFAASAAKAGTDSYYNLSWALFSTMMMSGNFTDLSQ
jgi:endo-1,4-beta-D-glucanase Y